MSTVAPIASSYNASLIANTAILLASSGQAAPTTTFPNRVTSVHALTYGGESATAIANAQAGADNAATLLGSITLPPPELSRSTPGGALQKISAGSVNSLTGALAIRPSVASAALTSLVLPQPINTFA